LGIPRESKTAQVGISGRHRRNPRELALEAAIARLDRFDLLILDDLAYVGKDLDVVSLPDNQIAI